MSRIRWYGPTLLLLGTVVLAMALGPAMVRRIAHSYQATRIEHVRRDLADNPTLSTLSDAFKDVAVVVRPSVTSIALQARDRSRSSVTGRMINVSNGSGWVYRYYPDPAGDPDTFKDYIITNHHVVEDLVQQRAERAVVRFDDGGEYRAAVVGVDPQSDVAVMEIDRKGMQPAALAAGPAKQGEIVFAVGSPFQFEFSMSQGIVSATGRRLHTTGLNSSYENFIQTDAAINPGNSGGPLTNVRGEVIGMNTAIAVEGNPAATFSGLGFAIPVGQVVEVANKLIENGEVRRGYIGVFIHNIDYATEQELGFTGKGVLCEPLPGGPADAAGMRLGDIITRVDGKPIATAEELRIAVSIHEPGSTIPIRIWRQGQTLTLQMTLAVSPDQAGAAAPLRDPFGRGEERFEVNGLGEFATYTPAIADRIGRAYTPGVLVVQADEDGVGLQQLDVVTHLNGQPVHGLEGLEAAMRSAGSAAKRLTYKRWDPSGEGRFVQQTITVSRR